MSSSSRGQAEHVGDHADGELGRELADQLNLARLGEALGDVVGRLRPDLAHHLAGDLLDEGEEGLQAVPDELVGDDVAEEAVLVAIAVLEDIRPEDVFLAELVLAPGVVLGAVEVVVVLEDTDDVVVAGDDPVLVEEVVVGGVVVAEALVEGEGILDVLGAIELLGLDGELQLLADRFFHRRHGLLPKTDVVGPRLPDRGCASHIREGRKGSGCYNRGGRERE